MSKDEDLDVIGNIFLEIWGRIHSLPETLLLFKQRLIELGYEFTEGETTIEDGKPVLNHWQFWTPEYVQRLQQGGLVHLLQELANLSANQDWLKALYCLNEIQLEVVRRLQNSLKEQERSATSN